jgi:hypothetical protein
MDLIDSYDFESQSYKSILKQDQYASETHIVKTLYRSCIYIFVILSIFPLTICDLYFGYNDTTCIHLKAGKLLVNLSTILKVDGILNIIFFITISFILCIINDIRKIKNKYLILNFIFKVISMFHIAWSVLGSVIFWGLIDNNKCDVFIYNYIYAKFILVFIINIIIILNLINN